MLEFPKGLGDILLSKNRRRLSLRKILVLGSLNNDIVFAVDHIVREGETITSHKVEKNAGGKGANQAAALGKAGLTVYFAGKLGVDGKWILDLLSSFGVDTSLSIVSDDCSAGQAIIQVDSSGQNSIILSAGGNRAFTKEEIHDIISSFSKDDILVLQNEINLVGEAIMAAKAKRMVIYFNPSPADEKIEGLPLEEIDWFFVNEIEAATLARWKRIPSCDCDFVLLAKELSQKFSRAAIVLTAGSRGAYYAKFGEVFFSASIPCHVVDTTGAGDTFCGYFIAALMNNYDISHSLEIANRAASITVARKGAMCVIPYKEEVF